MPRRNPSDKEHIERYTREVLKYGDRGKAEIRDLFVGAQRPKAILSLPPGPDRSSRLATLVGSLREIAQELAEEEAKKKRITKVSEPKKKVAKKRTKKSEGKASDIVWKTHGNVDRFNYTIGKRRDGYFVAKITKKGRNVIEDERAPSIYYSESLQKTFPSIDDAELAVRRVVNTAMIWYAERGIRVRERKRRTERVRKGVQRRTASMREAISKEEAETQRIAARRKAAEERKARIREEKVQGAYRKRRVNPEKSIRHIPRNNPSKMWDKFKPSDSSAKSQADKSYATYMKAKKNWKDSMEAGRPRFREVMRAYDAIENTRANLVLAGQQSRADKADELKRVWRDEILEMFDFCRRHLSKKKFRRKGAEENPAAENPGPSTHVKIANELLEKAKAEMEKYKESGSVARLLNAYSNYEMAKREFRYAKHKTGLKSATAGAKRAREELKKKARG